MNPAALQVIRIRALEEADTKGDQVPLNLRRESTEQTEKSADFLFQRSAYLIKHLPALRTEPLRLHRGWRMALLFGALTLGYVLTELGQERVINLLALPLIMVLAWNALMLCWGTWQELRPLALEPQLTAASTAQLWQAEERSSSLRRTLHVAAALVALGTIIGLYAKGWAREYRAVWESTLLDEASAQRFFSSLYKPAALILNLDLPLDQVANMRLRPDQPQQVRPAPALPWIHLYAGTLFLAVVLPRLLLVGLSFQHSTARHRQLWKSLNWSDYEAKLRRTSRRHSDTTGVAKVLMLSHQCGTDTAANELRLNLLSEHLNQTLVPECQTLPAGEEENFLQHWRPSTSIVVLLFNAATTPEIEVHPPLVQQVQHQLRQHFADSQLHIMLDARSLLARREQRAVEERLRLWKDTLGDAVEILVIR
jgi:hypothetical protein